MTQPARFTVLASGSDGNAAFLEYNGFGLLIDLGLNADHLTARLRSIGVSWSRISAAILTHIHTDHWKDSTLAELCDRRIPVYGHCLHFEHLEAASASLVSLRQAGLLRFYQENTLIPLNSALTCWPVRVSHDAEPTFAFRLDGLDHESSWPGENQAPWPANPAWAIGYASDLGCSCDELITAFAGVDVLALEYNHDVHLQRTSRRPPWLINRVLSDRGHLSNKQAAELTAAIVAQSADGLPSYLVQLHLSSRCNRPELAALAGREALVALRPRTEVITAKQDTPTKTIVLTRQHNAPQRSLPRTNKSGKRKNVQQQLPGLEETW
ncbi:MAG: MBL fold metallo-hydrolase [Gemmataceae bacterium]|nr:MBL fold metallo-hydrolase [Gemmata sp.]MDW8196163.1 MBL fold metallo-hydrolase [Gemmataceae bacterium]